MVIYAYRGDHKNISADLLKRAVKAHERENKTPPGAVLYHSISHTGDLWGCLISTLRVGFDLQEKRAVDHNGLAERFFLGEEALYVRENGVDGFYDVWTRKEACVKYFRTGLMKDIKSFSVVSGGRLSERVEHNGSLCFVNSFEFSEGIRCAYCSEEKRAIPKIIERGL